MQFHLIVIWFHLKLCTKKEWDCFCRLRERGIWLVYVRLLSLPFLYLIYSTATNFTVFRTCSIIFLKNWTIPGLNIKVRLLHVSRILKTSQTAIKWAFKCYKFSPRFCVYWWAPSLFSGIVFKFYMHVHNFNLHSKGPSITFRRNFWNMVMPQKRWRQCL